MNVFMLLVTSGREEGGRNSQLVSVELMAESQLIKTKTKQNKKPGVTLTETVSGWPRDQGC